MDISKLQSIYQNVPVQTKSKTKALDEYASFVQQRYNSMANAKLEFDQRSEGTQNLYYCNDWEWIMTGEDFEQPVRFPTLRDFIKTLTDTYMQDPPDISLDPDDEKYADLVRAKEAYIRERLESIHEKKVRRQVIEDMFFYGVGFRDWSYYYITRQYGDETKTLFRNVGSRRIDPRFVYVDENANCLHDELRIEGARDLIIRHQMPYSQFLSMYGDLEGFDISGVSPQSWSTSTGSTYMATNSIETTEKADVMVVNLYEYQNQEEDLYILVANGKTIFHSGLKKMKGSCGFTLVDYKFEPRNDSYWGVNLAQLIAPHIYTKDTIFNLELLNLKLTLQPVLAVSGDFGYNPRTHVLQPGGVWTAGGRSNGKVGDSIQPIVAGNPNTRSYDMLNNINGELSVTSRANLRALEFYKGKTATEVMQTTQSMNAHNETIASINEVESEAVGVKIIQEIMNSFLDREDVEAMHRIKITGYVVNQTEGSNPKFEVKEGYEDFFKMTEEVLSAKAEVRVTDRRSKKVQDAEKLGRIMQAVPLIGNVAQLGGPEVVEKVNFVGILEQIVETVGLNKERSFNDDMITEDEFDLIREEILLGNKIDVGEEPRKTSIERVTFLRSLEKKMGEMTQRQRLAWQHHFDGAMENIVRSHVKQPEEQKQAMQAMQIPGGIPQVPGQQGPMGQIPQPDARLLSPTGNKPPMNG